MTEEGKVVILNEQCITQESRDARLKDARNNPKLGIGEAFGSCFDSGMRNPTMLTIDTTTLPGKLLVAHNGQSFSQDDFEKLEHVGPQPGVVRGHSEHGSGLRMALLNWGMLSKPDGDGTMCVLSKACDNELEGRTLDAMFHLHHHTPGGHPHSEEISNLFKSRGWDEGVVFVCDWSPDIKELVDYNKWGQLISIVLHEKLLDGCVSVTLENEPITVKDTFFKPCGCTEYRKHRLDIYGDLSFTSHNDNGPVLARLTWHIMKKNDTTKHFGRTPTGGSGPDALPGLYLVKNGVIVSPHPNTHKNALGTVSHRDRNCRVVRKGYDADQVVIAELEIMTPLSQNKFTTCSNSMKWAKSYSMTPMGEKLMIKVSDHAYNNGWLIKKNAPPVDPNPDPPAVSLDPERMLRQRPDAVDLDDDLPLPVKKTKKKPPRVDFPAAVSGAALTRSKNQCSNQYGGEYEQNWACVGSCDA